MMTELSLRSSGNDLDSSDDDEADGSTVIVCVLQTLMSVRQAKLPVPTVATTTMVPSPVSATQGTS